MNTGDKLDFRHIPVFSEHKFKGIMYDACKSVPVWNTEHLKQDSY